MERFSPTKLVEPLDSTDHVLGPVLVEVVVVEYGDFECPTCKQAASAVEVLLERYRDRIRFGFRHFPLEDAHPNALQAAQAAECAAAQGKFWEMHKLLFERQMQLERDHLHAYAEQLDLDLARFDAELNSQMYLPHIRKHLASGKRAGVRGTPGFFVNGKVQDVSFGMRQLFDAAQAGLVGTDTSALRSHGNL